VELYYEHGPKAAGFIEGRERLKGLVRGALYPVAALCAFALEATAWQKALVTVVTLLVPFGMIFLVSRSEKEKGDGSISLPGGHLPGLQGPAPENQPAWKPPCGALL